MSAAKIILCLLDSSDKICLDGEPNSVVESPKCTMVTFDVVFKLPPVV